MAPRTIRPGSGRAWGAAGIAALLLAAAATVPLAILGAQIRGEDTDGWGALGLAILAVVILPIAGLSLLLVALAIALLVPRWAGNVRSRGAGIWLAAGVAAAAAGIGSGLVALALGLQLDADSGFFAFAAAMGGAAVVVAAIGGAIGWAIAGIGVDPGRAADEPAPPPAIRFPHLLIGAAAAAIVAVLLRQGYTAVVASPRGYGLGPGGLLLLSILEGLVIAFAEWLVLGALLTWALRRAPAWAQAAAFLVAGAIVSAIPSLGVYAGRVEILALIALIPGMVLTGVAFVFGWALARWLAARARRIAAAAPWPSEPSATEVGDETFAEHRDRGLPPPS